MDIDLRLVDEGGGKVVAHATIMQDDGTPFQGAPVVFQVNGRDTGKPVRSANDGTATKELTLKVDQVSLITVTVANNRHVTTNRNITPEAKKRRTATTTEMIISCLFLAVVATASYMSGNIGVFVLGIFVAMEIMFLQARSKRRNVGEEFMGRVQNNDWIFYMMRAITIFAFLMFLVGLWVDPPELNPIKVIGNQLKDMVSTELKDPWANERWFSFTGLFDGWGRTALFFLFWTAIAYPISFWDDWIAKQKANKAEGRQGWIAWIFKIFFHEGMGTFLWSPFRKK